MNIYFLFLGLIIGSFLNVCIYRIPRKESIAWPGSHCPECGYVLKWYDLIPVISYLLLRGKCRQCRSHISLRYPLVELLTGLLFWAAFLKFGLSFLLLTRLLFICLLIVIALIDVENLIIPNVVVLPGAVAGLLSLLAPGSPGLIGGIASGFGAALCFFLIWFFYPQGMGEGDIKLALMLGLFLGWPQTGVAVFLAALTGTVGGLAVILFQGGSRRTQIPFGLFLALGSLISIFFGSKLVAVYLHLIGWQ